MPFVHITWLPKACRTAAVRKEVSEAVMKALISVKSADISPANLVVRFSENTSDGFPCAARARAALSLHPASTRASNSLTRRLPKGFSQSPELAAPQKDAGDYPFKDVPRR
jgi:hypothetical protein